MTWQWAFVDEQQGDPLGEEATAMTDPQTIVRAVKEAVVACDAEFSFTEVVRLLRTSWKDLGVQDDEITMFLKLDHSMRLTFAQVPDDRVNVVVAFVFESDHSMKAKNNKNYKVAAKAARRGHYTLQPSDAPAA